MFHKVFATEQDIKTLYIDALKNISKEKKQDIRKRYTEVYGKIVTDKEKIKRISDEEAAAAYSEEIFGEDGVWEYLLDEEPTLKDKIISFFTGTKKSYGFEEKLSAEAERWLKGYKRLFGSFAKKNSGMNAIHNAVVRPGIKTTDGSKKPESTKKAPLKTTNEQKMQVKAGSDNKKSPFDNKEAWVRYSKKLQNTYDFTKSFSKQVEDYKRGVFPSDDSLMLGATPEIFKNIGLNSLPMTINQKHVDYVLNGTKNADHQIGEVLLKQLPQALNSPVAIITSKTSNSTSLVAILTITHGGSHINVPVYIDGNAKQHGIIIDSNAITSVYARKNAIATLLRDALWDESIGNVGIYYWNKKRAVSLLSGEKVIMPNNLKNLRDGSLHSIREKKSPVKPKFNNVTESQQFKRFFGDWQNNPSKASKVVNDDGTPKILYHQTDAEFTVFDPEHKGAGSNDDQTPFGIFMKPLDNDIGLKGKKQMALYARIINPLIVNDRAQLENKLKQLSPKYAELKEQQKAINEEYQKKIDAAGKAWSNYAKEYRAKHPQASNEEIYNDKTFEKLYEAEDALTEEWTNKDSEISRKCKEAITQSLETNNYDGVIIKRDDGSGGRSTETYIALKANQVKSATDNIGTFDKFNPDIRFSLKSIRHNVTYDEVMSMLGKLEGNERISAEDKASIARRMSKEINSSDEFGYNEVANNNLKRTRLKQYKSVYFRL